MGMWRFATWSMPLRWGLRAYISVPIPVCSLYFVCHWRCDSSASCSCCPVSPPWWILISLELQTKITPFSHKPLLVFYHSNRKITNAHNKKKNINHRKWAGCSGIHHETKAEGSLSLRLHWATCSHAISKIKQTKKQTKTTTKLNKMGWVYGPRVKSTGCSSRRAVFKSQYPHVGLQLSVSPVPGDSMSSSGLCGHQEHK